MTEYSEKTDVFSLREGEWQVRIGNNVLPHVWNSKGAAIAGLRTEARRRGVHELSKDCWCRPQVISA